MDCAIMSGTCSTVGMWHGPKHGASATMAIGPAGMGCRFRDAERTCVDPEERA